MSDAAWSGLMDELLELIEDGADVDLKGELVRCFSIAFSMSSSSRPNSKL